MSPDGECYATSVMALMMYSSCKNVTRIVNVAVSLMWRSWCFLVVGMGLGWGN